MPFLLLILLVVVILLYININVLLIYEDNTLSIFIKYGFIKYKLKLKSLEEIIIQKSKNSIYDNLSDIKENIKKSKMINNIINNTTISNIEVYYYDDMNNFNIYNTFIIEKLFSISKRLTNELFLFVNNENYLYFPFNKKKLYLNIKLSINTFKLLILIIKQLLLKLGGFINEQSRRFLKNKSK